MFRIFPMALRAAFSITMFLVFCAQPLCGKVLRVVIDRSEPVLDGKSFGRTGSYELLHGRVFFGFDPANAMNSNIVDLQLAPINEEGLVEAWADLVVLRPKNQKNGRNIALVEVSNRGGKFSHRYFNRASERELTANNPNSFGDGLLMEEGLTIIWVGWQFDVPEKEGLLRLHTPIAHHLGGESITGLVRCDWRVDAPTTTLALGHRDHKPYPLLNETDSAISLTKRDGRIALRRVIPRKRWQFAREENGAVIPDPTHIYHRDGFEAGYIYELVYKARDPHVVGLGLAAVRDMISYVKYDETCPFPAKSGIAAGVSQTGRFLRHFIYQGFNSDEQGRKAFDGMMAITAGAGRGSFNHRFAQPSRDGHRYSAFFYPTDVFPFTSEVQRDPIQWRSDGLASGTRFMEELPKTFLVNTGYEYWGRAASLIHTDPRGKRDIPLMDHERIYHIASGQHFVDRFPPDPDTKLSNLQAWRGNPLDFSVNYRALLMNLIQWVEKDVDPPASLYPKISKGELVVIEQTDFPKIPGFSYPRVIHQAYRLDFGPRWNKGIIDYQPPWYTAPFPSLVSKVDEFGNEISGIRNVELRAPLATYTPWHMREGQAGGNGELTDFRGSYIPLPLSDSVKGNDPRPSISSLYPSKSAYLKKVRLAAAALVSEGFLLDRDVSHVLARSVEYWKWLHKKQD